ncbi:splicing factor [Capsaspora owczarzaki ATCC 30864]|uniref:splicing factor n=1 Tax=Capsaspora owczarzaki (strain ATCC 30864) TaxID=595528 RepID=UPI0001FE5355|nr:splicing factor [Capsaspora owczarzaki ATCC 30864]|eukprot:XP_004365568.1 splicing factor [Capsaspora owczarzaki ATCC 30864]
MSDDQTPPAVAAAPRPAVHPDRLGNFAPGSVSADRSGGSENSDRRDDDDRDRRDQRDQRDQRDHRGGRDDRDRGGYDDYRGDTRGRPSAGGAKAAQISSNRAGEGSHSVASNANVGLAPPGSNEAVMMASGEDGDEMEDPDLEVMRMMGISGFGSTKGKHVPGADVSAAAIKQPRRYRQYMNRRGGFNRPLDQIK